MADIGVIWIEATNTQFMQQVCCHLDGTTVLFAADLQQIAAALDRIEDGAVFVRLPIAGVFPGEILTLVRNRRPGMPMLVEDLRSERERENWQVSGKDIYCVFKDVGLEKKTFMLDTLARSRFSVQLERIEESVSKRAPREEWREMLIGESDAMQNLAKQIRLVAPCNSTVLIMGETGTGKEVVARAIHNASRRGDREMVALNCGALPEALIEAELFGYTKGAFTGAVTQRIGRFEQAHDSTIFLDEIGDLALDLQSKLLRVLQEREFHRLGGSETIKVNVRVITATNIDLAGAVQKKSFREDLYYRLNVLIIQLPPLRQRTGDISLLVHHFIDKLCRKEGLPLKSVSPAALEGLEQYCWPGNVRQLEHATETAIILSGNRDFLELSDFPIHDTRQTLERQGREIYPAIPGQGFNYDEMMMRLESYVLAQALEQSGGNKSRAANLLQMKRSTLVSKMKALAPAP